LACLRFFAVKVFTKKADKVWLKERFAKMDETDSGLDEFFESTWIVQEIRAESEAKGEVKGLEEGIEVFVQARYPTLIDLVRKILQNVHDLEILKQVQSQLFSANSEQQAQTYLRNLQPALQA